MKLLVLGGTVFLGRHLVEAALAGGHEVTIFNRGRHNPDLFPQVEKLRGDRDGDLAVLQGRVRDAAVDTCGYVPRVVQASAELLAGAVGHYTFISTLSVHGDLAGTHGDFSARGMDESAPVATLKAGESTEEMQLTTYGALKVLCEQAAEASLPGRVLVIRCGLIVGPFDASDRFTYWPHRIAEGGEVLAPGNPNAPVQFIDVRDLSAWIIRLVERRETGTFNATGPAEVLTMKSLLEECKTVCGSDARFTWVPDQILLEAGVRPFVELPLWIPERPQTAGFSSVDCGKAIGAGLTYSPLPKTIRDTLAWDTTRPPGLERQGGLAPERERAILRSI
jgi:2'-hydroxyisoflavone reductase